VAFEKIGWKDKLSAQHLRQFGFSADSTACAHRQKFTQCSVTIFIKKQDF